jgi:hypothetical protein
MFGLWETVGCWVDRLQLVRVLTGVLGVASFEVEALVLCG